jgi:predicted transcriptional regulator
LQLNDGIKLFREFLNVDKNLITIYTDKNLQEHELLKNKNQEQKGKGKDITIYIKTCSRKKNIVMFLQRLNTTIKNIAQN